MIWSALEVGSVCYAHADSASLNKLQRFQDTTLHQLGITCQIDTLATRRKVAYASMVYKQVVMGEGPSFIREHFPIQDPDLRAHLSRATTQKHQYQLSIPPPPPEREHLSRFDALCAPLLEWNKLPPYTMPTKPSIQGFKKAVADHYHSLNRT